MKVAHLKRVDRKPWSIIQFLFFFSLFTAPLMKGDDIMLFKKKKKEKREDKNSKELKQLYESNKKLLDKLLKEAS